MTATNDRCYEIASNPRNERGLTAADGNHDLVQRNDRLRVGITRFFQQANCTIEVVVMEVPDPPHRYDPAARVRIAWILCHGSDYTEDVMSATNQKLRWAQHAVDAMRDAEVAGSREDFQYHFGMFLALIGALRHFISVDPHRAWIRELDEQNLYYCSCLDLRNLDVQIVAARAGRFSVGAEHLPATFAHHAFTREARATKSQEVELLRTTPAVEIAANALEFLRTAVLPGAQERGVPIP